MERSPICASCLSKYPDIRGLIYSEGNPVGVQCSNVWHNGPNYDPDRWVLSPFDFEFLSEQHVSTR